MKYWNTRDDVALRQHWVTTNNDALGREFGVHANTVASRAKKLGLPKKSGGKKPDQGVAPIKIERAMGRPKGSRTDLSDFHPMVGSDRLLAALRRKHA